MSGLQFPDGTKALGVLEELERRSAREQERLAELNALGPEHVRAEAPKLMLDVGRETGSVLHLLTLALNARVVVEVGASVGYSTVWLATAVQATGGRVISIEADAEKVAEQSEVLKEAGLLDVVEQVHGDSGEVIGLLEDSVDLALLDHWKGLYRRDFDHLWPKIRPGGMLVADNIIEPAATRDELAEYVKHARRADGAISSTWEIGHGLEITYKAIGR